MKSSLVILPGSNGAEVDQRRAVIFARPLDDKSVALMSIKGSLVPSCIVERDKEGSQAERA